MYEGVCMHIHVRVAVYTSMLLVCVRVCLGMCVCTLMCTSCRSKEGAKLQQKQNTHGMNTNSSNFNDDKTNEQQQQQRQKQPEPWKKSIRCMTQRVHERPSGQGRSLSRETREPHRASERAADADESNFSASSSLIPRFSFPLTHKKNSYAHVNKRDEKIVFINWNKSGINYKK